MAGWLDGTVGYQIYVRSFADSNGDGLGDLPGIRSRLPYLADLGVDLLWLTPFFPSPQADHGYDVSDPRGVDPRFGTIEDVRGLAADAHALGLRVLVDIVPNHVSDEHSWFQAALAGDAAMRDRFVVVPATAADGPPNNWLSRFGGPAWTHREELGGWYMHLFLAEQPDLNWQHEAVRAEYLDVLRHWFDVGLDGVRIDVAHSLLEDPELRDNPVIGEAPPGATPREQFETLDHIHDQDQGETPALYEAWRQVADAHDAVLLGETYLDDADRVATYVEDGRLHLGFWFPTLHTGWDHAAILDVIERGVRSGRGRFAWPLSSHDDPRVATRFGGGDVGARRAQAYLTLVVGLPGVPFILQGDELGLDDGVVEAEEDPVSLRSGGAESRDGSRTPMPWDDGPNLGFTTGTPWLPLGDNRAARHTVAAQQADPGSWLATTRALLHARRRLQDLRGDAALTWTVTAAPVLAYQRGRTVIAMSFGADGATVAVGAGTIMHASVPGVQLRDGTLHLPADSAAIVTLEE